MGDSLTNHDSNHLTDLWVVKLVTQKGNYATDEGVGKLIKGKGH